MEFIRNERPDLVICDVQLAGLDGYEIARQLRADEGLSGIPLVAVTAYAMVGDRDHLLAGGFDGYISKPIAFEFCFSGPGILAGRAEASVSHPSRY